MTNLMDVQSDAERSVGKYRVGPERLFKGHRGRFRFFDGPTGAKYPIPVHYAVPEDLNPHSPILFAMPGIERDGAKYRGVWAPYAALAGALLLVPEFPQKAFPKSRGYNLGNILDKRGQPIDRLKWSFSVLERLFDHVRAETGSARTSYLVYGHSAGGQFAERLLLLLPESRVDRAISANAGWHTLPDFETPFPYGLRGFDLSQVALKRALERPLTVLVGEHDSVGGHGTLRKSAFALRQGRNRIERGQRFVDSAKAAARSLGADLAWRFEVVQGAGHAHQDMADAAATALFDHLDHLDARSHSISTSDGFGEGLKYFGMVKRHVEIRPMLDEVFQREHLWSKFKGRQEKIRVQAGTQSIPLRSLVSSKINGRKRWDVHESRFTKLSKGFPTLVEFLESFANECEAELGRARVVKLLPQSKVHLHIDRGEYYRIRDRYHLVLQSKEGSPLTSGGEKVRMQVGELWWFDNRQPHEAFNESDEARIHLIFDLLPKSNARNSMSPQSS